MSAEIIQGDCLDVLRSMPDASADAIVTDPPYGIGKQWKGGVGKGWGKSDAEKAVRNAWDDAPPPPEVWVEMARVARKLVVWGGNYFPLPPSRCWFAWVKPERGFTLAEAELAWTNLDAVVRCFDAPRHIKNRQHPTQKPLALMSWCIEKLKLSPDSLVIDPYCGSGTTGVAAVTAGHRFIGIEREAAYVEIARKRLQDAQAQLTLGAA